MLIYEVRKMNLESEEDIEAEFNKLTLEEVFNHGFSRLLVLRFV